MSAPDTTATDVVEPVRGLTAAEVGERIADGRVNRTTRTNSRSVSEIIRTNVFTFFNLIVGTLFVIMLVVGPIQDALFGIVAIANTLIGIIQEVRAKQSLERLSLVGRPRVVAIRDGVEQVVEPEDVVLDDVVVLTSGTQLAVDGIVIDDESLEIDESLLTGESDPIDKQPGDQVLSGSFVVAGRGSMRVTAVGDDSYAAKLGDQASTFTMVHSQIRDDINRVLRLVTWALIPISILLAVSQIRDSESVHDAISGTVAGIITMIPEGLVLLTSIAFAVGVVTLGRQGCLVQELAAVEGLARVDVVCADKTGTLTEDRMEVVEIVTLDGTEPNGRRTRGHGARRAGRRRPVAERVDEGDRHDCADGPGWTPSAVAAFSSARKWSGVSFGADGDWVIGAPEILLADACRRRADARRGRRAGRPGPARAAARQGRRAGRPARRHPPGATRRPRRAGPGGPSRQRRDARLLPPAGCHGQGDLRRRPAHRRRDRLAARASTHADHPVDARTMPADDLDQASTDEFAAIVAATRCSAASPRTRSGRWSGRCRPPGAPSR